MASIVLGVVGAVIGAPFGMASLGWSIGSTLGSMLSKQDMDLPGVEGPRIQGFQAHNSAYGNMIPKVYGVSQSR